MKLATFSTADNPDPRLGVVRDDCLVDMSTVPGAPHSMAAYLSGGQAADEQVRAAAEKASNLITLDVIEWHAPVPAPGKMLGIGLNYADHIAETGMATPQTQMWFNKQHNCVNGPYADINLPAVSDKLDYEAELCAVIGKRCKHVPRERAHEVIAGYCCGNDVSVRDWQRAAMTMQIGKSFDTHGPFGPYLVTPDEVGDPHQLDFRSLVNGEVRQSSNTKHLIFDCYDAVAHLSQAFVLDPGDVLFMGTPAGVGAAMKPPKFLRVGDVVRIEIEKLGHLEAKIVPERAECVIE